MSHNRTRLGVHRVLRQHEELRAFARARSDSVGGALPRQGRPSFTSAWFALRLRSTRTSRSRRSAARRAMRDLDRGQRPRRRAFRARERARLERLAICRGGGLRHDLRTLGRSTGWSTCSSWTSSEESRSRCSSDRGAGLRANDGLIRRKTAQERTLRARRPGRRRPAATLAVDLRARKSSRRWGYPAPSG